MTPTETPAERAWRELGGAPELLGRLAPPPSEIVLPSRLDVVALASDSVALATLALHAVLRERGITPDVPPVAVDGARLVTSIRSERHLRIGGAAPDAWAPLSGFWETADGWVRTHGNYPHHADRLRRLLGIDGDATKEQVAAALGRRAAQEVEDEAARVGAVAVRVRDESEWAAHPQARAVREAPLVATAARPGAAPRPWTAGARRPLEGIRVLDLTRVIAGPVAGRDLAFAGAEVLRVDSPRLPEIGWQHLDTGQGKRSTRLDLASPADAATFDELLADADVLVTGYRPGALAAFGLTPETLAERHPGLVVGSVSAWGETGPWAERRGFDSIVQAASGIARIESEDGIRPGALPAQALDHSAGHLLAAGIVRALSVQRTHGGTHSVSVSLARVAQALLEGLRRAEHAEARIPEPTVQRGRTGADELVTALPVLAYRCAPPEYERLGGRWGEDRPAWSLP